MNTKEHLLVCLMEECAEIQQAASKALRFGLEDGYPGANTTNVEDIEIEIIELIAVIDMCRSRKIISEPVEGASIYSAKLTRVEAYFKYARTTGALND